MSDSFKTVMEDTVDCLRELTGKHNSLTNRCNDAEREVDRLRGCLGETTDMLQEAIISSDITMTVPREDIISLLSKSRGAINGD